ncbi:N-acetylmuramoyl-L-alanine amidase [Rhizorhapis suberifaciens]|uniref:N-acetylmuramoyl-L-alanine amidase n=1 Tax=Rhizorhapis suberifaciens TaxID=13656 RepID=A0A840HSE4_9SPHN|nr:N-acetylmuramoyl-L-alanine amidase [Rhizorhapis suberifaciens]MBB4640434.1 N-acetylmuramoyl-L-alanine amidase [Rhizorhapis suberifaciens]
MKIGWTWGLAERKYAPMSFLLACTAMLLSTPAQAGSISGVQVQGGKVILQFDGSVKGASAFLLDSPRRIALDIAGARPGSGGVAEGPIAAIRQGQFDSATARVVFDLARPAVISGAEFAPDGSTLTLSLKDADAGDFRMALARGRSIFSTPASDAAKPPRRTHGITIPIPEPAKGIDLPRVSGPPDDSRPLVVIDAGHGGHDPGALNKELGAREKDITLAVARSIKRELLKSGRVRVALTRDDDRFLVLEERYGIARRMKADLFISVHADAAENEEAKGATIYTLSEVASDREAARLAARENKADIINGINLGGQSNDVSSILIDLTQRETMNISASFAKLLQREAAPYVAFRTAYHRFASLVVLKAPDTPSVLLETGYITNADDVRFLSSSDGQSRIAKGVAKAVEIHFARQLAQN